ncbi:MAG: PIN domain-containing protein [Betaproteobacteria bacterium]|nr:PIN domain-containing protein [Betaproteobacteria bacterium]
MNAHRITLDTNLLVYAVDRSARDKHAKAQKLAALALKTDCVLTLQALSEFYFAVTRKGKLPAAEAKAQVDAWQDLFPVVVAKPSTLNRAITAAVSQQLGFWDAMLWATAHEAGVSLLLSEDFSNESMIGGVQIVNPLTHKDLAGLLGVKP